MPTALTSVPSLLTTLAEFALVIFAIVVHEVAHGFVAYKCGDPTAKMSGRLTLNPLAHIDLFGTVLLPFMLVLMGGPSFGYAKPVPYNPNYLKDRRRDEILVALAGPALVMYYVSSLVIFYIQINVSLAVFNMLPIPPLDGSKLLLYFLGEKNRQKFYAIEPYCMIAVVGLMFFAPGFFSSIIGGISNVILSLLARII
ncbi:MAG: site-2 protease family protein [Atopobium sp.]|nr:site-2 protease family protein [Atopobium sp.]